ncbi:MAG: hypothetical protein CM15mP58_12860 [Burkholderiaceae bacterium]|nr:MAG: hypothetical protein CM15mP58_12860 [Burkholderiaceae bacterium]
MGLTFENFRIQSFLIIGICFTLQVLLAEHRSCLDDFDREFLAIPILDSLAGARKFPSLASFGTFAHWVPRLYFLLHFYLLLQSFRHLNSPTFGAIFKRISFRTITGGIGITIAHELMHRPKKLIGFCRN